MGSSQNIQKKQSPKLAIVPYSDFVDVPVETG